MARLKDDAQWIVLMGFLVGFSLFFLAMVINQSTVVGQTTAESVIEFPKNDIRDEKTAYIYAISNNSNNAYVSRDFTIISLSRKNTVVNLSVEKEPDPLKDIKKATLLIHFNNGVTDYYENCTNWTDI
jgi:hypothetical protein